MNKRLTTIYDFLNAPRSRQEMKAVLGEVKPSPAMTSYLRRGANGGASVVDGKLIGDGTFIGAPTKDTYVFDDAMLQKIVVEVQCGTVEPVEETWEKAVLEVFAHLECKPEICDRLENGVRIRRAAWPNEPIKTEIEYRRWQGDETITLSFGSDRPVPRPGPTLTAFFVY